MRVRHAAVAVAAAGALAAFSAGCGSSNSSSGGGAVPAQLTVWRMGNTSPSQVSWMSGIISQFHKAYPAYASTKVVTKYIPWPNRDTAWTTAFSSGKNAPDITELGNTDSPTEAAQGLLLNIKSDLAGWSPSSGIVPGMLANDELNGGTYAVPWFGGVRAIWYRTDQFKAAGISSTPTNWAQLVSDAKLLMKKNPGTFGLGAPSDYTNAIVSFIWGAGGQVATQQNGKWVGELTSAASEKGIKFYADLLLKYGVSPKKYIGMDELGVPPATSGGSNEDFSLGKLDMYIDGPWAKGTMTNAKDAANMAAFPIPSEFGGQAPAFAGGSDLGVFKSTKYPTASFDLLKVMDSQSNATTFANLQGFFPAYTAVLNGGTYASSKFLSGFAKAATVTNIAPLNNKNWGTADATDQIIPTMMKTIMQGGNLKAAVSRANTELTNVLNTGKM